MHLPRSSQDGKSVAAAPDASQLLHQPLTAFQEQQGGSAARGLQGRVQAALSGFISGRGGGGREPPYRESFAPSFRVTGGGLSQTAEGGLLPEVPPDDLLDGVDALEDRRAMLPANTYDLLGGDVPFTATGGGRRGRKAVSRIVKQPLGNPFANDVKFWRQRKDELIKDAGTDGGI